MGIPSYFSHITRRHSQILKSVVALLQTTPIDHFFIDANSIIYDACKTCTTNDSIYVKISEIILKYIEVVQPSGTILVAFDGVAPMAKVSQQRTRRCKGSIEKMYSTDPVLWDTTSITPGTEFMNALPGKLRELLPEHINVSGPDEPGEGEHKIFDYIRNHNMLNDKCLIYGLDADLIMLSLLNLKYCETIYLAREKPYFEREDRTDELYCIDIKLLAGYLCDDLRNTKLTIDDTTYIRDYVFICFLLGNDFMPHFPAINIRHGGIDIITKSYKMTILKHGTGLTTDCAIKWKYVKTMIRDLTKIEYDMIMKHYVNAERGTPSKFYSDKLCDRLRNIPVIDRRDEEFIDPRVSGWEKRYYQVLFGIYPDKDRITQICRNYIEGLEWTFLYYTKGCIDWRWKYSYNYPPLLNDLVNHIPYFDCELLKRGDTSPLHPLAQLSYVLPLKSFNLLPENIREMLQQNYKELFTDKYDIKWAFCRYFWESKLAHPTFNINDLERDINILFK
jgi:5'-3' exonuclease